MQKTNNAPVKETLKELEERVAFLEAIIEVLYGMVAGVMGERKSKQVFKYIANLDSGIFCFVFKLYINLISDQETDFSQIIFNISNCGKFIKEYN